MPLRSLSFPAPPVVPHQDASPAGLLEVWVPELVERHQVMMRAVASAREAREARDRFDAAFPAGGAFAGGGANCCAAVTADAASMRRKHKPEALAALILDQPVRYGTWFARETVAGELVASWNQGARQLVTADSRGRLVAEEQRLRVTIGEAAEDAVRAAGQVVRGGDVLRAAWRALSEVDELAEAWRPVFGLLVWVAGGGWQAPSESDGRTTWPRTVSRPR